MLPPSWTEPLALLTLHGTTPWYADRNEWSVGQLDTLYWLAERYAADAPPVLPCMLAYRCVYLGHN